MLLRPLPPLSSNRIEASVGVGLPSSLLVGGDVKEKEEDTKDELMGKRVFGVLMDRHLHCKDGLGGNHVPQAAVVWCGMIFSTR